LKLKRVVVDPMDIEIHSLIVGDTKNPKGFAIKNPNILLM
jgi:hypothetical protein